MSENVSHVRTLYACGLFISHRLTSGKIKFQEGIVLKHSEKLKKLVVCALMIALANVLSFVKIDMPMGGGLTICSMVPIVLVSFLYGPSWGLSTAFIYSVFQLLFGLDNVAYATNLPIALLIIFFAM